LFAATVLSVLQKGITAVQWVRDNGIPTTVHIRDGSAAVGYAERSVLDCKSDFVQFERFGFVRIEDRKNGKLSAVFAHR